jgi:hypothetical protein
MSRGKDTYRAGEERPAQARHRGTEHDCAQVLHGSSPCDRARYESCRAVRLGGGVVPGEAAGRVGAENRLGCPQRTAVTYRYTTA